MTTKVYHINRDNHHSNKQKFHCSDGVITYQHDYRLIDGWFYENLEITSAAVYQINGKNLTVKQTKVFLF